MNKTCDFGNDYTKCDLYSRGFCKKHSIKRKCEDVRSKDDWYDDEFGLCEKGEVCRRASIFGNAYFFITDSDIEALKNGKVLFDVDEYGTFIVYKEEIG